MTPSISLRTQFSLIIILTTVLLLIGVLGYFHVSNRDAIHHAACVEVESYSGLLTRQLDSGLRDCISELGGLQSRIKLPSTDFDIDLQPVHDFVIGYAPKYTDVTLFQSNRNRFPRVVPVRVFGGETKARVEYLDRRQLPPRLMERLTLETHEAQLQIAPFAEGRITFSSPVNARALEGFPLP